MKKHHYPSRDSIRNYFPLPNEIFRLGLTPGELAVYSFLLQCENRETYQCYPSYRTIGEAVRPLHPWRRNENMAASVRKRSDGRWEARVVVGYDDSGNPKTKNVLAKTKAECLVKLEELKEKYAPPVKEDCPLTPNFARRQMQQTLARAQCKKVRFHDLRHTFATMALEHGMDVKTLSTIIGHISSATTLDIYSHVTDTMQKQAAVKIDHQIGKTDAPMPPDEQKQHTDQSGFQPYKSKYRKAGTGGIYQLNDHLWEGKYSPRDAHGKRISRNVYAKTRAECEEKLAVMIEEVKRQIAAEKGRLMVKK